MQLCPHCSTTLEDGARFCGACGKPIEPKRKPAQTLMSAGPAPTPAPVPVAAPKPAPLAAPPPAAAHRPVEPLAATMVSSGPLPGFPPAAARAAPPAAAPPPALAPTALPPAPSVRPARTSELFVGRTLNHRYVVQDKVGEGGFGAVFRGRQIATGREVALKILHPHNVSDPTIVARFRREAEACSKLRDPHTVTTYDFDETEDGVLYLVMELLHGQSLHLLQKSEGPFPFERVLGILDQVAESLGEAHQNGIVHRDMKPENVIVETRGEQDYVKVLDFGIAKVMSGDKEAQALTAVGQTLGTLEFMSPEQLRGIKLDGRSDIYALGMMAYEMLTGELPFKNAKSPIEIINFHMKDQSPPPSKLRPDLKIPAAVDEVLLKMVAKSREERFANIGELRDHIGRALASTRKKKSALPFPAPFNDYRVLVMIGTAVAVVVGALVFLLRR